MSRTGKIARLPRALREEINRRLQNGTPGRGIVQWLNERPDVKDVMEQHFGGRPLNEQNLTEWKQGGYAEWEAKQELVERVREAAGDAGELADAGGLLADRAAHLLSAQFVLALREWDGEPDHPAAARLRALSTHSRELIALRRGDHSAARLRMEQARFDKEQGEEEEMSQMEVKHQFANEFQKWLHSPEIWKIIASDKTSDAERIDAIQRRVYGPLACMLEPYETQPTRRQAIQQNLAINGDGI